MARASNSKRFLLFILLYILITDLSIILNIPVFRQVLGFTFLAFVPGLLILYILKLDRLGPIEKTVCSIGLSVSFSMFVGLLINLVYPFFSYSTPLSTNSLLTSFSVITLILTIIAYLRNRDTSFGGLFDFKLNTREKAFLIVPALFPLISILGIRLMNTMDNNVILMALLFLIPTYTIFITIKHRQVPVKVYAPIILLTSIAVLLMTLFRSSHIIGIDIHNEFYLSQLTTGNQYWQTFENNLLSASLLSSLITSIYQAFLSVNPEHLFQILHYFFFALIPLVVYLISRKYIGNLGAFLASFFLISQVRFLAVGGGIRTDIAILFFALAIMVVFHDGFSNISKRLLFIIFSASCILSHYSTSYIFFFLLLLTWIGTHVITRLCTFLEKHITSGIPSLLTNSPNSLSETIAVEVPRPRLKGSITLGFIGLFFTLLFFWYSQITEAAFRGGVNFIALTLSNIQNFFILESRGGIVSKAFGSGLGTMEIPNRVTFIFSWLTIVLIAIGILITLASRRSMVNLPIQLESGKPNFLTHRFDTEFFVLSLACSAVLVASVALPFVYTSYGVDRAYFQMMTILSPFFVIGGMVIAKFLRFRWAYLITLVVLIPYFMCNIGVMHQIFGVPQSIILNSQGQQYDVLYVHDQETSAAIWIKDSFSEKDTIYTDYLKSNILKSQGKIISAIYAKQFVEENRPIEGGYIYLGYSGAINDKLLDSNFDWHHISDYQNEFAKRSLIYNNGGSEIWR